jgi:type VI secretion system protein ImpF
MSTDHSERTVRPSLLDRLIDDVNQHEPRTWEESVAAFKASVMRDLQWLLNTRRVHPMPPRELDLVRRSIYAFGIRDLSSRSADSVEVRSELQREVQEAITTFEPRLSKVRVTLAPRERGAQIRFSIEAELRTDPSPEAVLFETTLDVASKVMVVTESTGGPDA